MASKNIISFKTVDKEGKEIELIVQKPNVKNMLAGQDIYSQTYRKAVENGDFFRSALERHLIEQQIWGPEKQKQLEAYNKIIAEGEETLAKGKISKQKAKDVALTLKLTRAAITELLSERNQYDSNTVEGKAENAKFNYWVSVCTVYNNKEPYFSSLEDYLNRADEQASFDAAQNLATLIYGLDSDYESKLPENKFLKHFGYINDKGEFVNEDGKRTDMFGSLLDEDGDYIDESGEKLVNKEIDIDFDSFFDDEKQEKDSVEDTAEKGETNETPNDTAEIDKTKKRGRRPKITLEQPVE